MTAAQMRAPWLLLVDGQGRSDAFPRLGRALDIEVVETAGAPVWSLLDELRRVLARSDRVLVDECGHRADDWRTAADELGARFGFVVVVRHPAETFRPGDASGVAAWLGLVLRLEHATRDVPRAVVRHEDVAEDWQGTLTRVEKQTGLPVLSGATVAQVSQAEAVESPDEPREPDWAALELPADLRDLAARTYAALCSIAEGLGDLDFVDALRGELDALQRSGQG